MKGSLGPEMAKHHFFHILLVEAIMRLVIPPLSGGVTICSRPYLLLPPWQRSGRTIMEFLIIIIIITIIITYCIPGLLGLALTEKETERQRDSHLIPTTIILIV